MLTDKPNIVIAHAPKYAKRKKPEAKLTSIIADHREPSPLRRGSREGWQAADRLWLELKQAAAAKQR